MKMDVYTETGQRVLYPDEGKIIATKEGIILGSVVWLGKNASEHDFIEVDEPVKISTDEFNNLNV